MSFTDIQPGDPGLSSVVMANFRHINYGSALLPVDSAGAGADNTIDLGSVTYNFKDGFFAGDLTVDNITIDGTDISTSASELTINEAGSDVDFRIEGVGAPNAFFVQGSNGNVGIGDASPEGRLHIKENNDAGIPLIVEKGGANPPSRTFMEYKYYDTVFDNIRDNGTADILYYVETIDGFEKVAKTQFYASNSRTKTTGQTLYGKMSFGSYTGSTYNSEITLFDGNVGIGTSSPDEKLHISGNAYLVGTSAEIGFERALGSTRAKIQLQEGTTTDDGELHFLTTTSGAGGLSAKMVIDEDGNVGIGTTGPDKKVEIVDNSQTQLRLSHTASTYYADFLVQASGDLTITSSGGDIGFDDENLTTSGTITGDTLRTGSGAGDFYVSGSTLGVLSSGTLSFDAAISGTFRVEDGLYIGTFSSNNLFDDSSNGSGSTTMYIGNQSITVSSDKRYKKDIVDSTINALDLVNDIRIVDFEWDDPTDTSYNNRNARGKWTGFLAQEAIDVIPTMVNAPRKRDTLEVDYESEQRWTIDHSASIPILMKAIQELTERIEALEKGI